MATTQTVTAKTETSLTVYWETSLKSANMLSYSLDNGSTWSAYEVVSGREGYYTVENLTPNTTYSLITSLRTQTTWVNSSVLSVATYSYPYATMTPDFTIGSGLDVGLFNPLGKTMQVQFLDNGGNLITYEQTSGTSVHFYTSTQTAVNALYGSIPNALSGTYSIRTITSDSDITNTGGLYQVDQATSKPTIGTFTYADNTASSITQDSSIIVQNISTPVYTATCTANNSATLATCVVDVNGATYSKSATSTTTIQGGTINSASNVFATLTLTDSRGLTSQKTVEITMAAWSNPTGIINVNRQQNFYSETDCNVDADYTQIGTNTVVISLTGDAVPITGKTTPAQVTATLTDNVTSVVSFDNDFEWNLSITITDSFGGATTYTGIHIGRGIPINFTDRILRSYAVNGFPTHQNSVEVFEGSFYKDGNDIASLFPITQYNSHDSGSLTSAFTRNKTYTVTNDGLVYVSASLRTGTKTWGTTRVTIFHNNSEVAKATDILTSAYDGQETSANANAFLQVSNGDTIKVEDVSTRYTSGNTWDAYYNLLAFGCTLSVS